MSTPRSDCTAPSRRRPARVGHAERPSRWHRVALFATSMLLIAAMMLAAAPMSVADAAANLRSLVDGARGGCAPLQVDPVLTGVAQRVNRETQQYKQNAARYEPFEDPMPVLQALGYQTGKAKMLAGFGDEESEALRGVVLFGWESIPDCSYTRYGVDVLAGDGYTLATAILAAP
jgi:hypothetical protein